MARMSSGIKMSELLIANQDNNANLATEEKYTNKLHVYRHLEYKSSTRRM